MGQWLGLCARIIFFTLAALAVGYALPIRIGIAFGDAMSGIEGATIFDGAWLAIMLWASVAFGLQVLRVWNGVSIIWLDNECTAYIGFGSGLALYAGCLDAAGSPVFAAVCAAFGALYFLIGLRSGPIDGWDAWAHLFDLGIMAKLKQIKKALLPGRLSYW